MSNSLRGPGPVHGFWATTAHPTVIDAACALGPDFVCVDAQHGTDLSTLSTNTFTAMAHYDVPGLVRVARNGSVEIGRALDLGAAGVMVPMIDTAQEAQEAVDACRYAPRGTRSFGMQTVRVDPLSSEYEPICAVQIETATAVTNIGEIAAVEGVDWLYIGPADLALSFGGTPASNLRSVFDGSHPLAAELLTAFEAVVEAATTHEKLAGLHTNSGQATLIAEELGFRVASVATDRVEMTRGMAAQLRTARQDG
jgi:4-hydroxy-2-oxoheptanedioate aldolase